jgi:hypothetical protein
MHTTPSIQPSGDERVRFRRLMAVVALLSVAWIGSPYLVRILFGTEVANGTAGIGMVLWLMTAITITKPERSHLSKQASGRIHLFVAAAFVVGLAATTLYLWFHG